MLNHVRRGSDEPLVLIHEIGGQWQMWTPVLDALAAERDVVAFDLPGFGASVPLLEAVPTLAALADAVGSLIDELGLGRPHVAGNSLGGASRSSSHAPAAPAAPAALSPIGFARGRERAFARRTLAASRAAARALDPAVDVAMRTAPAAP